MASFVTRFAPSPTGLLHRGHAYSALLAHDMARAAGGQFLLRIEDIDTGRRRPEFDAAIVEDLAWLGVRWDGPVLRQADRQAAYQSALNDLIARGLVYRCFFTRREVMDRIGSAPHGPSGPAFVGAPLSPDEEAARLEAGAPFAWRLSVAASLDALSDAASRLAFEETGAGPDGETGVVRAEPSLLGDVVVARKDLGVAYHLAVVVDDAHQGVSHVVRGHDLFASTHVHRLLQALLGAASPRYHHHRLICGPDGARLAKRDAGETLASLRAQGWTPDQVRHSVGLDRPAVDADTHMPPSPAPEAKA